MKRIYKNIIASTLVAASTASIGGTMYVIYKTNNNSANVSFKKGQNPPGMSENGNQKGSMGTPPSKPSDSSGNSQSMSLTATSNNQSKNKSGKMGTPPSGMKGGNTKASILSLYYVAFGIESFVLVGSVAYLIISKGSSRKVRLMMKSKKKILIAGMSVALLTGAFTVGEGYIANHYLVQAKNMPSSPMGTPPGNGGGNMQKPGSSSSSSSSTKATGKKTITNKKMVTGTVTSTKTDQSTILVKSGGNATIKNATIKKSGASSNTENSEFYGVNAGILVQKGSTAKITNSKITTSAKGANAVFATGSKSKITISNSTIKTTGSASARGLDATYGGTIIGNKLTITTKGGSCATLATDRGEGTVSVSNSKLTTNGSGSPVIYSTGKITLTKSTGTANKAQAVVVEGKNTATVKNSTLTATGEGNRGTVDQCGVMIYQSMSGDAGTGVGTFNATNSKISIEKSSAYYKSAPMFFVTNTSAVINLTNTKLSFGSGTLLSAKGTSQWGTSGSNGGNVKINAKKQTLTGRITADKLSTVSLNLTNGSTYKGAINSSNTAKKVTLKLDKSSKITLTGDTYVTSLSDADSTNSNINLNGHKLYVNGKLFTK